MCNFLVSSTRFLYMIFSAMVFLCRGYSNIILIFMLVNRVPSVVWVTRLDTGGTLLLYYVHRVDNKEVFNESNKINNETDRHLVH